MHDHRKKFGTDQKEVATMQKLYRKWPGLEKRGRFVLAFIYGLLVTLALILAAAAPYEVGDL